MTTERTIQVQPSQRVWHLLVYYCVLTHCVVSGYNHLLFDSHDVESWGVTHWFVYHTLLLLDGRVLASL